MKKFFYLFAVLALVSLSACNDNDETVNKQTSRMTINNRAVDGDNVVFSQGIAKVELDYTNMLVQFTTDYKDINGQSHTITTPQMKLSLQGATVYKFDVAGSGDFTGIEQLTGYIDFATGAMWFSFEEGSAKVYSSTHLLYNYTTTMVTNPDNNNHFSHDQSAYMFALNAKGDTCTMTISNFIPNMSGSVQAGLIQFSNLTVTPTTTGYTITADEAESSYRGFYTITDLDIELDTQGLIIGGSFKCSDLDFTLDGRMFPLTK